MLQSIRLTLQSHKDSLVEFHPGVNYIIGRSRQGKSSILRALVKTIQNRPIQGMERWVHRHDPKNTLEVEVVTSEGHCVVWEGSSPQRYIVDGEELSGFGQGVPQAVTDALHLGELNIAGQHDLPFLLFDTPGEVARTLNRVVHLDVIDRALANHAAIKRRNDQDSKVAETAATGLAVQAGAFPDLEAGAVRLASLEARAKKVDEKGGMVIGLGVLQEQLAKLRIELEATRIPDGVPESMAWLMDRQVDLEGKVAKFRGLHRLQGELRDRSLYVQILEPGLAKDGWITELLTKQKHLEAKRRHIGRLQALNGQIRQARTAVAAQSAIISQMDDRIKDEFGKQCPLCGQEIRDAT